MVYFFKFCRDGGVIFKGGIVSCGASWFRISLSQALYSKKKEANAKKRLRYTNELLLIATLNSNLTLSCQKLLCVPPPASRISLSFSCQVDFYISIRGYIQPNCRPAIADNAPERILLLEWIFCTIYIKQVDNLLDTVRSGSLKFGGPATETMFFSSHKLVAQAITT